jgi:L-alanine-DL-glutamate epimerase-like enolase superfamily enzyme
VRMAGVRTTVVGIASGGLLETRMIALADLHSAQVALHTSNGPVCSAAALHLHAASPNVRHALAAARPYRALHFNLWAGDWHRRDV